MNLLGVFALIFFSSLLAEEGIEVNGGFETGDGLGWTEWKSPWGSGFSTVYTEPDAFEGENSLHLSATTGSFGVYQEFCVEAGVPLTVTWAWKGAANDKGWWEVLLVDAPYTYEAVDISPGSFIIEKWEQGFGIGFPEPSADWKEGSGEMIPTSDTVTLVLKCGSNEGGMIEAFFDSVVVMHESDLIELTGVSPPKGSTEGGTEILISGTNLTPGSTITIGGEGLIDPIRLSTCQFAGITPVGEAGPVDIEVSSPQGMFTLPDAFVYVGPPGINSIDPAQGPLEGGTDVTIRGENFEELMDSPIQVRIGENPLANLVLVDQTTVMGTTPPGVTGAADVVILTPFGEAILPGGFTYESAEPIFRRGDVDRNGVLELTDVIKALNFQFVGGIIIECEDTIDVDDNGALELTDAIRSLNFQFAGSAGPPEPPGHLTCGPDVNTDSLAPCDYPEGVCN